MAERAPGHKEENKDNNKNMQKRPSFFPPSFHHPEMQEG